MRHTRRIVGIVLTLLLAGTAGIAAQDQEAQDPNTGDEKGPPPYETYPQALGVAYGPISGTGLHYHLWDEEIGYAASAGVVYLPPAQATGNVLNYVVGGEIQRRVYGDSFARWLAGSLYVFGGGNHRGFIPVVTDATGDTPEYSAGAFEAEITAGLGIGIEIVLFQHFSIPAEFGYAGSWVFTQPNPADAIRVQLYGQTALRYRY